MPKQWENDETYEVAGERLKNVAKKSEEEKKSYVNETMQRKGMHRI